MREYNLKESILMVVLGFTMLCICLYFFVFPSLIHGGPEKIPRVWNDQRQLGLSMEFYRQEFGSYPTGGNSNIVRMLAGDNSKKITFFVFRKFAEHPDEIVDPWKTPYQIDLSQQTNFIIRSAGKDKIFGTKDDIVFNTASNDFVKP